MIIVIVIVIIIVIVIVILLLLLLLLTTFNNRDVYNQTFFSDLSWKQVYIHKFRFTMFCPIKMVRVR